MPPALCGFGASVCPPIAGATSEIPGRVTRLFSGGRFLDTRIATLLRQSAVGRLSGPDYDLMDGFARRIAKRNEKGRLASSERALTSDKAPD